MPKMKTRKAAAKRFKITGSGKVLRRGARTRHLLECKHATKRRRHNSDRQISKTDEGRIKVMMPYGQS